MNDTGLYALLIGGFILAPLVLVFWLNGFFRRLTPDEKAKDRFSLRLTPAPKKQSYTHCPWCGSRIEVIRRTDKAFQCPICEAAFRNNYAKWGVAIPLCLGLCLVLLRLTKSGSILHFVPPIVCVFAGVIASVLVTRRMQDHIIVVRGLEPPPPPTQSEAVVVNDEYQTSRHISIHRPKQLAAVLTLILTPIAVILLIVWLALR